MDTKHESFEPAKSLLTILGLFGAIAGVLLALREYSESVDQRRVENALTILREFSPVVSMQGYVQTPYSSTPQVRIEIVNKTAYPVTFVNAGVRVMACDESATPIKLIGNIEAIVETIKVQEFDLLPGTPVTITASTDILPRLPPDYIFASSDLGFPWSARTVETIEEIEVVVDESSLVEMTLLDPHVARVERKPETEIVVEPAWSNSGLADGGPTIVVEEVPDIFSLEKGIAAEEGLLLSSDLDSAAYSIASRQELFVARPFIVEFVYSASSFAVDEFEGFILMSGMKTPTRDVLGRTIDVSPFTWIYRFRFVFRYDGSHFVPTVDAGCVFPNSSDVEVEY